MHFFNPVPLMKLVEVVSGLHTDAAWPRPSSSDWPAWGKVPVHARSTPGFIVNRIARPYYAETLALLLEQAATPAGARRLPARGGLPHGAVRADGPDRPRHQLRGHPVGL
jgi:3-hydroxyacyl-CoA dehydrogenase